MNQSTGAEEKWPCKMIPFSNSASFRSACEWSWCPLCLCALLIVSELALNPLPALMEADQVVICFSWRCTSELRRAGPAIRKPSRGKGPMFFFFLILLRGAADGGEGGARATQNDSSCHGSKTKRQHRSFFRLQISGASVYFRNEQSLQAYYAAWHSVTAVPVTARGCSLRF